MYLTNVYLRGDDDCMAKNYQILRAVKLSQDGNVRGSLSHAFRERETLNADQSRTPDNILMGAKSLDEAMENYRKLLPEKVRKNAVKCVEYLITISPEAYQRLQKEGNKWQSYFNSAKQWVVEKHGQGVFFGCVHMDESTPHMTMYAVPLDEKGHLNARSFLGGRKKLSEMQTDFYEKVSKNFGLERGLLGSKARHQTIKSYYGKMAELEKAIEPPKRNLLETDKDYAERYKAQLRPLLKIVLNAQKIKDRNDQLEEFVAKSDKGFKEITELKELLTPEQMNQLKMFVAKCRQENERNRPAVQKAKRKDTSQGWGD